MSTRVGDGRRHLPGRRFDADRHQRRRATLGADDRAKGSITLDGVSLTVNDVRDAEDGSTHFSVNIIPHTAQHTTLGDLAAGTTAQCRD